ncbi:MAG: type II/IV secretion system protein, partial [Phycisphaerales bacterium]|nr:type II/IV secretion system protein [Phycisphaerales bacterium]
PGSAPAPGSAHSSSDSAANPVADASVVVRYRVDGALIEAHRLPRRLLDPIVGRVKVMAQMDIAERRLPQDGRAAVTIGGQEIDLRVSSLPTAQGERLVIRLLDKRRTELFDLERLGMPPEARRRFAALCERPHGMILVTGPTGSGKTTTLYSALLRLNRSELNIMTLEDPIEYELPGISQSQINPRKGVTFGSGLRHVLRQDPDVIMVGEIRDAETAKIAVQSALTGHLVFSTLHTNSAASAVTRLVDLGVEPYLINAALTATLAQRLVRTLCADCRGAGCAECSGKGFRGRLGLYELLVMDARLRELVAGGASASALHEAAVRAGMQTLREGGLAAVANGLTTRSEVDRVTLADEALDEDPIVDAGVAGVGASDGKEL